MRIGRRAICVCACLASTFLSTASALAQDDEALLRDGLFVRDRNVSVTERPKPEYQALPVRLGVFILDPVIAAGLEYNDNIYALSNDSTPLNNGGSNKGIVSDGIFHLQPSATLTSDWSRNQISAFARTSSAFYFDNSTEDTTDYAFGANGRLDVRHDLGFAGGASNERETQPRTSEASPDASTHPVRFDVADAYLEGTKEFGRLRLTARGSVDDYTFDNAYSTSGEQIYEKDQDHTTTVGALKAEYAYLPNTSFLISLTGNHREYRNELPVDGSRPAEASRTSSGYEASVGANFDLSHLARGEVFVGYLEQEFDNSQYKSFSGFSARGKVQYFPTPLTTLTLSGSRSVVDSGIFDVGGFFANAGAIQLDHELLRNLVLSAVISYTEDDYQNYSRTDKIESEQVSASYLLNRAVSLTLAYSHLNQNSTGSNAGPNYDINRVIGSIAYRF